MHHLPFSGLPTRACSHDVTSPHFSLFWLLVVQQKFMRCTSVSEAEVASVFSAIRKENGMSQKGPMGGSDKKPLQGPQFADPGFRISGFNVWSGDYVDAVQFQYVDTSNGSKFTGDKYGGGGGNMSVIVFAADEDLVGFDIHAGNWIDQLTFLTSTGDRYTFGGSGGRDIGELAVDASGQRVYAIAVGTGSYLNQIEIYYQ
jgi:hypothetical protein